MPKKAKHSHRHAQGTGQGTVKEKRRATAGTAEVHTLPTRELKSIDLVAVARLVRVYNDVRVEDVL